MSRVGIFGGTFDPIHIGHLITAQFLFEKRNLDKLFFIPCYISPHKTDVKNALSEHRLKMVELSIEGISYFSCSDFEINKAGISYTIDTLREFKKHFDELELIIGYDNIFAFDTWKEPDEIFNLAKVVVMKRTTDKIPDEKDKYYQLAEFIDTPIIEVSSTEIRKRIKEKKSIDFLVTEKVKQYIYKYNLYLEEN